MILLYEAKNYSSNNGEMLYTKILTRKHKILIVLWFSIVTIIYFGGQVKTISHIENIYDRYKKYGKWYSIYEYLYRIQIVELCVVSLHGFLIGKLITSKSV